MKEKGKSDLARELKVYKKKVGKSLCCDKKTKRKTMQQLSDGIDEYLEHNPDADFEEIKAYFGTPESIAEANAPESQAEFARVCRTKKMLYAAAVVLSVILIFSTICCAKAIYKNITTNVVDSIEVEIINYGWIDDETTNVGENND